MGVQVAGRCLLSPINSPTTTPSQAVFSLGVAHGRDRALSSPFLGAASVKLLRARSLPLRRRRGSRSDEVAPRRCFTAGFDRFVPEDDEDEEEEEFVKRLEELAVELQQQQGNGSKVSANEQDGASASFCSGSGPLVSPTPASRNLEPLAEPPWLPVRPEPTDWPGQIVPASVKKNANSLELPLSLRIIKRKKRWENGWLQEAGESAYCSVKRAFSSMVFMLRELQSYRLQMREVLFREDLQGILSRVQREMESSFVWLFQQIFSCTPTLMVSVMLLLANFTVYSMDGHVDAAAMAARNPPNQSLVGTVVTEDHHPQGRHDRFSVKSFSTVGRTASVGGNGAGGGGNAKPVAGATDDGRSNEGTFSYPTILPDGISTTAPGAVETEEGRGGIDTAMAAKVWQAIVEEASRMKASTRDEALVDPQTLQYLVAPVTVKLPPDDYEDYLRTEMMYRRALSREPENALLLANFAQFLYVVFHDHDRAEYYFKKATGTTPADAEALSRYASFLWRARKDMAAAEEVYLEAIAADPDNSVHTANYAHFLWNTGGEETCYPLSGSSG